MNQKLRQLLAMAAGGLLVLPAAYAEIHRLSLPARSPSAPTGSEFRDVITSLPRESRENAISREVLAGNVPEFLRVLKPISLHATVNGQSHSATVYVTPDYLAVGSDADYFLLPMTPLLAQCIADATSTTLPTRKIADAIWSAASCKLPPSPIAPSAAMVTVPVFWNHQQIVQAQRSAQSHPLGELVAGHKKDVTITPRLYDEATSNRVAIYGWHQPNGVPIQNIYLGHEETYADYSHGVRLVNNQVLLDGVASTVQEVLTSSSVSALLNDEATSFTTLAPPRYETISPRR